MDAISALMLGQGLGATRANTAPTPNAQKNADAARQTEAFFAQQLLAAMRRTVPQNGLLSGGRGEEVMRSFLDEALAQKMAASGSLGIAHLVQGALDRQEPAGKAEKATPEPNGTQ